MKEQRIHLACCQLRTELDWAATMDKAGAMVREAARQGAQIVVLPEMFCCPYSSRYFHDFARRGHEETVAALSRWAAENRVLLVGGSVPEREGDRLYNSCFVFDEQGRQIARHRKVHLFDIDLPQLRVRESDTFSPGGQVTTFETRWGTMGAAVCFDLRFPELFRAMAVRGAKVIFLPAQFSRSTGRAHWKMALAARAVDNECFLVGASAACYEGFDYECWGHSAVLDPFGQTLAEADEGEQILHAEIDLARVEEVRRQLPTFLHLRRDVYTVTE